MKSRAHHSTIRYNRIVDERSGRSNYTIDLSSGGDGQVIGNVLQQGPFTENETMVTFAPEGQAWPENLLLLAHNTLVSDAKKGNFVYNHGTNPVHAYNNIFLGSASVIKGAALMSGNLIDHNGGLLGKFDPALGGMAGSAHNILASDSIVADRSGYDYHLAVGSAAINAAIPLPEEELAQAAPTFEYAESLTTRPRALDRRMDIGAFEFSQSTAR